MKKAVLFCLFFAFPVFSSFAGSFYSNIVVLTENTNNLLAIVSQLGIVAYCIINKKWGIIFEQKIDKQDISYGKNLTKSISQKINGIVIYTTNHDSDILLVNMYKNGEEIFGYNSAPGYFEGKKIEPEIIGIENLLNEFNEINRETIIEILNTKEIFSDYIHRKLIKLINLPLYSMWGYTVIENTDEETIHKLEQENDFKIIRIN
jgi:hypothetical protein